MISENPVIVKILEYWNTENTAKRDIVRKKYGFFLVQIENTGILKYWKYWNTEILEYWKYWNTEFFLSTILVIFKKRFEQYWITELISGKAGGQAGKKYWITELISEKPVGRITEFFQQRSVG